MAQLQLDNLSLVLTQQQQERYSKLSIPQGCTLRHDRQQDMMEVLKIVTARVRVGTGLIPVHVSVEDTCNRKTGPSHIITVSFLGRPRQEGYRCQEHPGSQCKASREVQRCLTSANIGGVHQPTITKGYLRVDQIMTATILDRQTRVPVWTARYEQYCDSC